MSDTETDDTDALLASDPAGGLDMFLGLSLKELSDKHKNILNTSTTVAPIQTAGTVAAASEHSSSEPKKSMADSTLNNLEELDTSDFFNSRGELVLSGLSEWTDSDVDTQTADEDARSEAGSEASFTFETVLQPETPKLVRENRRQVEKALDLSKTEQQDDVIDERDREIVIDTSKHNNIVSSSFKTFLDMSFGRTPSHLHRNPNFGRVVDINLLKPTEGWNIPLPNHSTGQVFTRAPNFRTPGGYKPSPDPEEYRELTEDEMHEEVLRMYAFPDELDNLNEQKDENSNPPQKVSFATEEEIINDTEKQDSTPNKTAKTQKTTKVRFDFVNGENKPPVFGSEPSDEKAMKRKHLISDHLSRTGAGDCGSPSPSESSVRFNIEDSLDSKPKTRAPTKKVTYSTKVVRGKRSDKKKSTSGFSFGYGESESELSPIKGVGGDIFNTPISTSSADTRSPSAASSVPYSLAELKTVWREIQERKQMLEEDTRRQANRNIPETENSKCGSASSVATEKEFRGSEKTEVQNQQAMLHSENPKYSPRSADNDRSLSTQSQSRSIDLDNKYLPLLESFASDLEAILLEADINPDEFEDIIDDLQSGTNMANLVEASEHFNPVDRGDGCEGLEPSDAAAQVQLSDWAKSGAVEYVEKYQDERLRREQCEIEIQKLQKELLEIKQRNAVLDGKMKKKDKLLYQISSAWHNVSKEWKTHEAISQAALAKLQKEQNDLIAACTEGNERISQYEQELVKTVELADSFKCKIVQLEDEKTIAVMKVEDEKGQLAEILGRMEKDVDDLKHEKETALRALRESQLQLDERTTVYDKIQSELISLEENAHQNTKRFDTLVEQKKALESHLQNVTQRKLEVENELQSLTRELEAVRIEKEDLRRNLEDTTVRKIKEEGDRLHEYYNKQVQEVLNSAKDKAAKAEVTLMNSMKKASSESERKLNECRERHNLEVKRLKSQYECELQLLKKENLQKQLLITTTAQQLQSGELARSSAVNRLQTIVSSMPDNSINSERTTKDRRRGSESSAVQITQNSVQYSKFSHNLSASGQNHQIAASQSADFNEYRLNASNRVGDSPQVQDISRYNKTSTPITTSEMLTDASNQTCPSKDNVLSKASKLCKYFETANSNLGVISESRVLGTDNSLNDMRPNSFGFDIESVEHDRRVRSLLKHPVQVLKSVDPILETPVRLQKEGGLTVVENPDSDLDATIDPALQKCLEELIKSYAQKLDVIQTQKETLTSAVVQTGDVPTANNNQTNFSAAVQPPNKVKVKVSYSKTDKVCSSSSSMPVSESDNLNKNCNIKVDKDSSKDKGVGNQTSGKRPWK